MPPFVMAVALLAAWPGSAAPGPEAARLEGWLAEMHPDYGRFIRRVRAAPGAGGNLYMGLVRPDGEDPRLPGDAPRPAQGQRYDLVVFAAAREEAWSRLLLDHEYFHARRLAHADRLPHPTFGGGPDRHFAEALAWGYSLQRAGEGAYGALPPERRREAEQRYRQHRRAVQDHVLRRQPSAWAYYARLLPER
jgi:hypothetical protein